MNVQAILDKKGSNVLTTDPDASVPIAVGRMRLENIAALVVVKGERIVGIVSERDIVSGLMHFGADLMKRHVYEIMTQPTTCTPDDDIRHVMARMTLNRTRHLPVVEQGHLVGIVSIGDVVKHRVDEVELEMAVLRDAYLAHH